MSKEIIKMCSHKENPPLSKCCNTCPFLKENADKPNPEGWVPVTSKGQTNWYTQQNLNNLWHNGLKEGDPMKCHTHDPKASTYGGKDAKHEFPKLCMGAVMMQFKHVKRFETLLLADAKNNPRSAYKKYKKEFGKIAMTFSGITETTISFAIGRTDLIGGLPIPQSSEETRPFREVH